MVSFIPNNAEQQDNSILLKGDPSSSGDHKNQYLKRQSNIYTDYSGVKSDQHSSNKRSIKDIIKEQFQNQNLRNDSATEEKPALLNPAIVPPNIMSGFSSPKFGEQNNELSQPPKVNPLVNSAIASSEDYITNENVRDQGSMH
jgi:hypothetical protein